MKLLQPPFQVCRLLGINITEIYKTKNGVMLVLI